MKILGSIILAVLVWGNLRALTLDELLVSYRTAVLKVNDARDSKLGTLNAQYAGALRRFQASFQSAGDLDRVLLVKEELNLVEKGTWPLPPLAQPLARDVGQARRTYSKSHVAIERNWALETSAASEKMKAALEAQVTSLTRDGDLEGAKKAQSELVALASDPDVIKANELPGRLTAGGRARAAYILRRPGDDLEVLVRYDNAGKVSMKSPVENVVEKTGGLREKGKTTARTLGDFVGATGFQPDPFVTYEQSTESGNLEFSDGIGTRFSKKVKIQDQMALELEIAPKATNAYVNLNNVLPSSDNPGSVTVTLSYLVPSGNQSVVGLNLRHGDSKGGSIGDPLVTQGKWTTESREAASSSPLRNLRLHFSGLNTGKMKSAWGDRVFLKSLKIEQTRFSALIVEAYGTTGEIVAQQPAPLSQKFLIKNGELLPN